MMLRRTRPPSVPTAAAYKRPPFLAEKTHTIPSYLPDILLSLLALSFELAGVDRAPRRPDVPGVLAPPSSRRLDEVEEEELLRRTAPPIASRPFSIEPHHRALLLAVGESLARSRVEDDDYVPV
jgi:hypothetical protein